MIEFYLPLSFGEWLAWLVALGFVLVGLFYMILPKTAIKICGYRQSVESTVILSGVRGNMGGIPLGLGLSYLVFAQPFLAIALFFAAFFAAFGRLLSFVFDKSFSGFNCFAFMVEIVFAVASFVYAFGYVA